MNSVHSVLTIFRTFRFTIVVGPDVGAEWDQECLHKPEAQLLHSTHRLSFLVLEALAWQQEIQVYH